MESILTELAERKKRSANIIIFGVNECQLKTGDESRDKEYMDPILFGHTPDPKTKEKTKRKRLDGYLKRMEQALENFDTKWLGNGTEYIDGNSVTVADLLAACEL
ncbi:unnamed protein product [Euphydryas editha]|uniref:Glutathione S-transferase C-terminal domain-containing protein n=1 Tax=Euphydryas editha TaxID=104508 RepID=A0AAU9U344_EUPED|nr:unnamed protein product [Euphydryas editha]